MREGEIRTCGCNCGQPLPHGSSPSRQYIDSLHAKRAERQRARARMGMAPGQGSPSPSPRGAPPTTCHSTPQRTADVSVSGVNGKRRPPPEPAPPDDPPLPINDPTVINRALAEARALLALPHVASVTINRDGLVTLLRVGPMDEPVADVLCDLGGMQGIGGGDDPPSLRQFLESRRTVHQ